MKIKNAFSGPVANAYDALMGPGNRMPTLMLLAVERNLRRAIKVSESIERIRQKDLKECGASLPEGAANFVFPDKFAKARFDASYTELMEAEQDIPFEILSEEDFKTAFYRQPQLLSNGKPNLLAGKREDALDWDPQHFFLLRTLGLISGAELEEETSAPENPRDANPSEEEMLESIIEGMQQIDELLDIPGIPREAKA